MALYKKKPGIKDFFFNGRKVTDNDLVEGEPDVMRDFVAAGLFMEVSEDDALKSAAPEPSKPIEPAADVEGASAASTEGAPVDGAENAGESDGGEAGDMPADAENPPADAENPPMPKRRRRRR